MYALKVKCRQYFSRLSRGWPLSTKTLGSALLHDRLDLIAFASQSRLTSLLDWLSTMDLPKSWGPNHARLMGRFLRLSIYTFDAPGSEIYTQKIKVILARWVLSSPRQLALLVQENPQLLPEVTHSFGALTSVDLERSDVLYLLHWAFVEQTRWLSRSADPDMTSNTELAVSMQHFYQLRVDHQLPSLIRIMEALNSPMSSEFLSPIRFIRTSLNYMFEELKEYKDVKDLAHCWDWVGSYTNAGHLRANIQHVELPQTVQRPYM